MAIKGVSEVVSLGGYVRQYQVEVDPEKRHALKSPLSKIKLAIQRSKQDLGGRHMKMAKTEVMLRGKGSFKFVSDIENAPIGVAIDILN